MDQSKIAQALLELADAAKCIAGDFHTMHLNFKGQDFDAMHKQVLQEYYEEADKDYDSLAEFACCYPNAFVGNANEAATRITYKSAEGGVPVNRAAAIERSATCLELLCSEYVKVFKALETEDCPIATGISNWLQGRIEYWAKEMAYFNARRKE